MSAVCRHCKAKIRPFEIPNRAHPDTKVTEWRDDHQRDAGFCRQSPILQHEPEEKP